jgi:hypothetical protein
VQQQRDQLQLQGAASSSNQPPVQQALQELQPWVTMQGRLPLNIGMSLEPYMAPASPMCLPAATEVMAPAVAHTAAAATTAAAAAAAAAAGVQHMARPPHGSSGQCTSSPAAASCSNSEPS